MKKSLIALALLLGLSGCTTLNNAGHTSIEVTPTTLAAGGVVCALKIADGKERMKEGVVFDGGTCQFTTAGEGVKAFKGQGIAAKAATPLPTMLGDILDKDK